MEKEAISRVHFDRVRWNKDIDIEKPYAMSYSLYFVLNSF